MRSFRELLNFGENALRNADIEDFSFDAFQLLLFAAKLSASEYYVYCENEVSSDKENVYLEYIKRRIDGEPLQYILGEWSFYESDFYVGAGVLIPRPETEELVERVICDINEHGYKTVYDLCAGSGCIGLSIAKACPNVHCYLFELYDDALYYTEKNAKRLKLSNVTIIKHDITLNKFDGIPLADVIVSNPPYIESAEIKTLQREVLREPISALDGGDDGLEFYRAIKNNWLSAIEHGGAIAVECAEGQSRDITALFSDVADAWYVKDAYGCERFVFGRIY